MGLKLSLCGTQFRRCCGTEGLPLHMVRMCILFTDHFILNVAFLCISVGVMTKAETTPLAPPTSSVSDPLQYLTVNVTKLR